MHLYRWLKFEEDVEDGGERWSKPYVATLSLHSLFELRSCVLNGTVLLDMHANTLEEIASKCFVTLFNSDAFSCFLLFLVLIIPVKNKLSWSVSGTLQQFSLIPLFKIK